MTRSTVRDYKKTRRHGTELVRWREFGVGLMVGAVAAAAVLGLAHREPRAAPESPHPEAHRIAPADPAAAEAASSSAERYDFYQMLPHFEVVVPEKERDVRRDIPAAKVERPGVYVLQAGSYRDEAEADRVAKQLALQGIAAKVQRVAVDNDVWHRVRVGPISDLDELNRVRKKLQDADLDALVIRVGD
ncbi:MAG TPA: SPOR domain-containing protein [Steroidobacteraceae bacterium]|nr:SPOR domain-containing protein [Steroidobacteraceae bacterium]